jgi:hypothetical protein
MRHLLPYPLLQFTRPLLCPFLASSCHPRIRTGLFYLRFQPWTARVALSQLTELPHLSTTHHFPQKISGLWKASAFAYDIPSTIPFTYHVLRAATPFAPLRLFIDIAICFRILCLLSTLSGCFQYPSSLYYTLSGARDSRLST